MAQILHTIASRTLLKNRELVSPSATMPSGWNWLEVVWDIPDEEALDPTKESAVFIEASLDGGETWIQWGGASTSGSPTRDLARPPRFSVRKLPPAGSLVRMRITSGNENITIGLKIQVEV